MSGFLEAFGTHRTVVLGQDARGIPTGLSIMQGDMLMHQFGSLMSAILRITATTASSLVLNDTGNVSRTLLIYGGLGFLGSSNLAFMPSGALAAGGQLAIGTSATAPTRADVDIGGTIGAPGAPNQAVYLPGSSVVTLGKIFSVPTSVTITEVGVYLQFPDQGSVQRTFLMAHDSVSPGVALPTGGLATVVWTLQI